MPGTTKSSSFQHPPIAHGVQQAEALDALHLAWCEMQKGSYPSGIDPTSPRKSGG
jgi:hypothetical protein